MIISIDLRNLTSLPRTATADVSLIYDNLMYSRQTSFCSAALPLSPKAQKERTEGRWKKGQILQAVDWYVVDLMQRAPPISPVQVFKIKTQSD